MGWNWKDQRLQSMRMGRIEGHSLLVSWVVVLRSESTPLEAVLLMAHFQADSPEQISQELDQLLRLRIMTREISPR